MREILPPLLSQVQAQRFIPEYSSFTVQGVDGGLLSIQAVQAIQNLIRINTTLYFANFRSVVKATQVVIHFLPQTRYKINLVFMYGKVLAIL